MFTIKDCLEDEDGFFFFDNTDSTLIKHIFLFFLGVPLCYDMNKLHSGKQMRRLHTDHHVCALVFLVVLLHHVPCSKWVYTVTHLGSLTVKNHPSFLDEIFLSHKADLHSSFWKGLEKWGIVLRSLEVVDVISQVPIIVPVIRKVGS